MDIQILETYKPYLFEGTKYKVVDQDETHLVIFDSKGQYHFISKTNGVPYKVIV